MPEFLSRREEPHGDGSKKFDTRLRRGGGLSENELRSKLREQADLPPKTKTEKFES